MVTVKPVKTVEASSNTYNINNPNLALASRSPICEPNGLTRARNSVKYDGNDSLPWHIADQSTIVQLVIYKQVRSSRRATKKMGRL